mgnify:CR=1 FL=1
MATVIHPFSSDIKNSQLWVSSPAVAISGTNMQGRYEMVVANNAGVTLYLGSAGVTMNNGFPIAVGEDITIPVAGSLLLYGVGSGTGSADVRILELA